MKCTLSRSFKHSPIIWTAFLRSSSEMINGGAKRMLKSSLVWTTLIHRKVTYMLTCVGLANKPLLFNNKQSCQAVLPFRLFDSSMTTAFRRPRPRTVLTNGELMASMEDRKTLPRRSARAARSSSTRTCNAVMATAQPSGFLDKVTHIPIK